MTRPTKNVVINHAMNGSIFEFKASIRHPNTVINMTGGNSFDIFFQNVVSDSRPISPVDCGGYQIEEDLVRGIHSYDKLWERGLVEYSFVSDGSDAVLDSKAVYIDQNIGLSRRQMEVMIKAMKAIMEVTCIRFQEVIPEPNKKWLMFMKEGTSRICHRNYIKTSLQHVEVHNLGQIFNRNWGSTRCVRGAWATLGAWEPSLVVVGAKDIGPNKWDVGLIIHQLLHTLGVGHTQNRPGPNVLISF